MIGYILGKSETHNQFHQDLVKLLQSETDKIGVYINERMLNLPPYLVPHLHNQICEDIKWVIQENQPEAPQFDLKYMLFMTK
jgi:BCCIP